MNKVERMKAVFSGQEPDITPAGFWFHYPAELTAQQTAEAHVKLYRELDSDIVKVMDDSFGHMVTEDIRIQKPSDWRSISLPGRDCSHYRKMEETIRLISKELNGEAMIFPTVWSPFKIASFTYVFGGSDDATFMRHCGEDPDSVLAGIQTIADTLTDWVEGYIEAGASGVYYTAQFSEPQRFDADTWAKLVKPSDLQVLNRVKALGGYVMLHLCGEAEFGFRSSPERYVGYPGDIFNWDVHRTDVSLKDGRQLFHGPVLGGLDNHGLLINGSISEIEEEASHIVKEIGKAGFMLGADCTVPADISLSRLQAAIRAVRK